MVQILPRRTDTSGSYQIMAMEAVRKIHQRIPTTEEERSAINTLYNDIKKTRTAFKDYETIDLVERPKFARGYHFAKRCWNIFSETAFPSHEANGHQKIVDWYQECEDLMKTGHESRLPNKSSVKKIIEILHRWYLIDLLDQFGGRPEHDSWLERHGVQALEKKKRQTRTGMVNQNVVN